MGLRCAVGLHAWAYHEGETLYSRAGILVGSVTLGSRICRRCGRAQSLYRYASLMRFGTDATRWKPLTDRKKDLIEECFVPLEQVGRHRRKRRAY